MDREGKWGLSLASLMFLVTVVNCQNQTAANETGTPSAELVPGSLRMGTNNVFTAPDLFGGEPFSLKTDPVTGQVDFQTRTVDVQTVKEAQDREEAQKVAELRQDLGTRVPSSADLPLEARDEEYEDSWGQPIKRGDTEYYDEEEPEAREPIMTPQNGPTTPKDEESFMSIFESLFGGGEETPSTTLMSVTTTERIVQRPPERFANYQQPPERYNPYQQINRPSTYQQRPQRPPTHYQREPERPNSFQREPERPNIHHVKPENFENKPTARPEVSSTHVLRVTPMRTTTTTQEPSTTTTTTTTTTTVKPTTAPYPKENINRQDTFINEIKPANFNNQPDYFNFINLPVHYSTKDTAIPLISGSYANTKVQGMGAGKYDGKYSNHQYEPPTTSTRRPSYWTSRRPTSRPITTRRPAEPAADFTSLEYDDAAIGAGADFGGYGHKQGVKVQASTRPQPIRTTTTVAATPSTTTSTTTTTPRPRTTTQPPPFIRPSNKYDSYPAQVQPVPNPITTRKPADPIHEESRPTTVKVTPKPSEPEYEYYDYDTEPSLPASSTTSSTSTTTTTTTTTTAPPPPITTSQKYKIRYPSLSKDRIKRPEEKVEVVVPTKIETTSTMRTTTKEPAPVFEESEEVEEEGEEDDVKPIIVTAGKKESENVNIVLVPAKSTTENVVTTSRRPETRPSGYTTEFTVGVVQGQRPGSGHFIASSIAASPFDGPDEPFRPISRPAGMSASFQVVGDDSILEKDKEDVIFKPPGEPDIHEPHEFIPSPQFHRPNNEQFVVSTSFNTGKPYKNYQPPKSDVTTKRPQRPLYSPPPPNPPGFYKPETPNLVDSNRPHVPHKGIVEDSYYKPTIKPADEEDYGWFDIKKPQTNVELSVDYDGIQTEPKPGQYVIFKKPQLNSEMNENQVKKAQIPHFHEPPTTEAAKVVEEPPQEAQEEEPEKQQEIASSYPRPHWEKNGKPSFISNARPPPPQMSSNLIPPANVPPRFRKPVAPANLPPMRKNYNEASFQTKVKPNLPNILPQFRPNAKIGQRPYRPLPPNRRKENFPYRIQNEPDALMHRDFQVEDDIMPKFITNRVRLPEYDPMMIQKRMGAPPPPPSAPRRVQRTPVTTLQMLQQNHGVKKQQPPTTREDQADPSPPKVPPAYKPFQDKNVYVVYPVKTPFNGNIKIEDPDKIDYSYNQTFDQVPLLKPSKKRDRPKPDFPYGFVTPEERIKNRVREPPKEYRTPPEVKPNIQDYMPSGVKVPMEKQEKIDMNLHMQSNNQWNQVSNQEVITRREDTVDPPTQYHTLLKNTNASEFTLGAVMHTLPEQSRKGQVTSVNMQEENPSLVRPGLNVNERIANGKIVTVSMPLDVKEENEDTGFQAPFQTSSTVDGNHGWNILQQPENEAESTTEDVSNTTFNFENFTPELIGGFKPIYNTPEPEEEQVPPKR